MSPTHLHPAFLKASRSQPDDPTVDEPRRPVVLVVDDEREILASIKDQLRERFEVVTAVGAIEGLRLLGQHDISVVLSDQRMPAIDGTEFLARARAACPDATRILITGYADLQAVVDAVNRGHIYAYVEKPWTPEVLESLVSQGVERRALLREREELLTALRRANWELEQRVEERTRELSARNRELEEAHQRIEELARTDPLTGVSNRRGLADQASREIPRARRTGQPIALVMLDLDHFKAINDQLGHDVGDAVLRAVGALLRESLRPYDVAARLGGEEFAAFLPGCRLEDAAGIAERLRAGLARMAIPGVSRPITASFGVTTFRADEDLESALRRVDRALYRSKHAGRNLVTTLSFDQESP